MTHFIDDAIFEICCYLPAMDIINLSQINEATYAQMYMMIKIKMTKHVINRDNYVLTVRDLMMPALNKRVSTQLSLSRCDWVISTPLTYPTDKFTGLVIVSCAKMYRAFYIIGVKDALAKCMIRLSDQRIFNRIVYATRTPANMYDYIDAIISGSRKYISALYTIDNTLTDFINSENARYIDSIHDADNLVLLFELLTNW